MSENDLHWHAADRRFRFGTGRSLVARGERILLLDQDGHLFLIRANPDKFGLLDSRQVSQEETRAVLAVSGNERLLAS